MAETFVPATKNSFPSNDIYGKRDEVEFNHAISVAEDTNKTFHDSRKSTITENAEKYFTEKMLH